MKISYACCQHLGQQILSLMYTKSQPNDQKNHFPWSPFKMDIAAFNFFVLYII
jgi:hypothetical protein